MAGNYDAATPLTRRRTREAQAAVKARRNAAAQAASSSAALQKLASSVRQALWTCPACGGAVSERHRVRCDTCINADPAQTPEIRGTRWKAIAACKRTLREWEEAHPGVEYDPEMFRREILPRLAGVRLSAIVEATGMSKGYASVVRRGQSTPHVSVWAALAHVVGLRFGERLRDRPGSRTENAGLRR